jgi:signal transduction histidine kinase
MNNIKLLLKVFLLSFIFLINSEGYYAQQHKQPVTKNYQSKKTDSVIKSLKSRIAQNRYNNNKDLSEIYWQLGQGYETKGMLDSSVSYLLKGWDILKTNNYKAYFDQYLPTIAYRYWEKGDYSKSLSYLLEAERNIEDADSIKIKNIYNIFGLTYTQLGNYQLAEKNFQKALKTSEQLNKITYKGIIYANLGKLFYKQNELEKALEYYRKGSKIEVEGKNHNAAGRSFAAMAEIHLDKNEPEKAKQLLEKARQHNNLANDKIGLCRTYNNMGKLYLYQNNYAKAKQSFHKSEELAKGKGTNKELMKSYKGLYETYYKENNHSKAFSYFQKYHELYKKSYNVNEIIKAEKLQHELNLQQEINKRQQNELENQKTVNNLLIIILSLSVVLAVILSLLIIRGKRIRKYLQTKNQQIRNQKNKLQTLNKELEEAKAKTEESERLKDQFLRNMSHEIRTPLNGIMGFSSVIAGNSTNQNERTMYHQMIEENAKTLLNTIDDILDIAKIKSQQVEVSKENVNVNSLLLELKKMFFFDKSYQNNVALDIDPEVKDEENGFIVHTDPYKLRRVLLALIDNSLKFTKRGSVNFGYRKENGYLRFFVADTGIGISKSNKKDIFNSFNQVESGLTRTYSGVGLGLTIAKAFVEILGGNIWFDSEINEGSTFYFTIPVN